MRPGVEVVSRAQPVPRSAPTDTGVWFAVGETATGPLEPVLVRSLTQYEEVFGPRAGGVMLFDSVETYFREGGNRVWISAIPTTPDVFSRYRIDRGAGLASVTPEEEAELTESDLSKMTRAELDQIATDRGLDPADYAAKADVVAALSPVPPPASASAFAATTQQITDALDLFPDTLGPGQVSVPGNSDAAVHAALLDHAQERNRVALLDPPEDANYQPLLDLAAALRLTNGARYGALFAPWAIVPGITVGTHRVVPYSAVQAGIIARNDAQYNPNQAAAGQLGQATYALYVEDVFKGSEYESLNEGGVNMVRMVYGGVETYGYRTLVDADGPQGMWRDFGWARLNMAITALSGNIGELYVFSQIDGKMATISSFGGDLRAMLLPFYDDGALYGEDPDDAFDVNVGNQVNTPETIANGELHAVMSVRMSPMAELVRIEIVKVATTQSLAAAA